MLLLIDNFDSFSHILADYFRQSGLDLRVVRNDTSLSVLNKENYAGLVLSPGPETPSKAGNLLEILEYYQDKIPVLGVCLGHQAIGQFFGAKIVKCPQPVHGKVFPVRKVANHPFLEGIPSSFNVTRYHSLELSPLPPVLRPLLETLDGSLMAMAHESLPIIGIQFHPEAYLTEFGLDLIRNWAKVYCKSVLK